jgi:hypothetical protein
VYASFVSKIIRTYCLAGSRMCRNKRQPFFWIAVKFRQIGAENLMCQQLIHFLSYWSSSSSRPIVEIDVRSGERVLNVLLAASSKLLYTSPISLSAHVKIAATHTFRPPLLPAAIAVPAPENYHISLDFYSWNSLQRQRRRFVDLIVGIGSQRLADYNTQLDGPFWAHSDSDSANFGQSSFKNGRNPHS